MLLHNLPQNTPTQHVESKTCNFQTKYFLNLQCPHIIQQAINYARLYAHATHATSKERIKVALRIFLATLLASQ